MRYYSSKFSSSFCVLQSASRAFANEGNTENSDGTCTVSAQPTSKAFEILARVGYAARGLVYCLVALLALLAVRGTSGPLQTLLGETFRRSNIGVLGRRPSRVCYLAVHASGFRSRPGRYLLGSARYTLWLFHWSYHYMGFAGTTLSLAFGWGNLGTGPRRIGLHGY